MICYVDDIPARDSISANPTKRVCGVLPDIQ